jgi:hypothetical protein
MASPPETLDEPTALAGAPDQVRRARIGRHAKPVIVLLAIALILLLANGHYGWISGVPGSKPAPIDAATPTVIDEPFAPKALRPLSPTQAEAWNRQIPQTGQVSAATPIVVAASDPQSFVRSLQCMTEAIYYEAGNEPIDGQRAVAQVILNRMRSSVYPHSVCGVVYQGSERKTGCQFTFTCDGSLARAPARASWDRATHRRRRPQRQRLCAGRLGDELSCRLRRTLLGAKPGQAHHRRTPHLLRLEGGKRHRSRVHQPLRRDRAERARRVEHGWAAGAGRGERAGCHRVSDQCRAAPDPVRPAACG